MKVNNGKVGGPLPGLDTGKAGKTESAAALKKENPIGGLKSKTDLQGSSNVNVSERAQMMAKAKEIAGQPMSVDEAKVARLQKMIDEGKYKVDADSVADRLVDEHLSWD